MDFKRARTEEQKNQRINEILLVTEELFLKHSYTDITLKIISDKLDYTRGNLYKYFSNKEDIFLSIYQKNLNLWINDIIKTFSSKEELTNYEFSDLWSKTLNKYQILLKLYNLLSAIIEENLSFERLVNFKSIILADYFRLIPIIEKYLPFLQGDSIKDFLFFQLMHASALYTSILSRNNQLEALKTCDSYFKPIEFYPAFRNYIYTQISGYKLIQNEDIINSIK